MGGACIKYILVLKAYTYVTVIWMIRASSQIKKNATVLAYNIYYLLRVIVDKIWCFRFGSSEWIVKISIYFVDWSVNTFTYVNLLMKFLIRRQIPGILIEFFLSI